MQPTMRWSFLPSVSASPLAVAALSVPAAAPSREGWRSRIARVIDTSLIFDVPEREDRVTLEPMMRLIFATLLLTTAAPLRIHAQSIQVPVLNSVLIGGEVEVRLGDSADSTAARFREKRYQVS